MQKARSRLADKPEVPIPRDRKYVRTLPLGLLGLGFGIALLFLLINVPPENIANIPLPNAYGPFLLLLFFMAYFLIGYILQSLRWGLFAALAITIPAFLHFQHVVF